MSDIPFSEFQGYLKKIDLSRRPEVERMLFEQLFPQFFTKREIGQETRKRNEEIITPFRPLLQYEEDLDQPRRFAGVSLPRGRYYSVCKDSSGDDGGALVNELRAYRDPNTTGRVDVVDLARDPNETFGPPRPALAVILYDVNKSSFADQLLRNMPDASTDGKKVLVVEYPYEVLATCIKRTIDLRLPAVRRWFFEQFSKEQKDGAIIWVLGQTIGHGLPKAVRDEMEWESVTILSRFQRKVGIAPIPKDFYTMLPTLMNPELGGGTTADGGAILQAIGTWMCRNEVGALIYPSARSDAFVEIRSGVVSDFGGWALVDYREAINTKRIKPSFIVQSPWAWIAFPRDVRIAVEDTDSTSINSFRVIGMEAYWRRDYRYRLQSLEAVDAEASIVGEDVLIGSSQEVTKAAAWRLGASSIEWLTLNAVDKKPEDGARQKLLFAGLASRLQCPFATGRIDEIERDIGASGDVSAALPHSMDLVDWVAKTWRDIGSTVESCILILSNRVHVLRFFVAGMLLARKAGISLGAGSRQQVSILLGELHLESSTLSENTQRIIATTVELGLSLCDEDNSQPRASAFDTVELWHQHWDKMCKTVWEEVCRLR